jgi:flagella synthesis protein FlgN
MTSSDDRFHHFVSDELSAAQRLVALLQEEQVHLIASDTEGLAVVTERKNAALKTLAELGSARNGLLVGMGVATTPESIRLWLATQGDDTRKNWSVLMAVAAEAKEVNRTNGLLINQKITQNQNALNVLTGGAAPNSFYGPNGQSTGASISRGFAAG